MKASKISEHIWSLKSWMGIPVHVWVVVEEDGVVLVDAGAGFMAKGILKFLDQLSAGPLQRILLTHGHSDHTGSLEKIRSKHHVPVLAHELEIPYMEGNLLYPGRKKLEYNVPPGTAQPLSADKAGGLEQVGSLIPYLTPGHSPGHTVYYHEQDDVLLAGDLFTSKKGRLRPPMRMFTADMAEAVRSAGIIRTLKPAQLAVCHGKIVSNPYEQLDTYVRETAF